MDKGIYCLVMENPSCVVEVGALGPLPFARGWHVYIGSAQGPGGLARVSRHIRVKRTGIRAPRWHLDHLLIHPAFRLVAAACAPTDDPGAECRLAGLLPGTPVPGFGCSDCSCRSHLNYFASDPEPALRAAFSNAGLLVTITTLNRS